MPEIREYRPEIDTPGVRACLVELQDHERTIEPALIEGAAMADAHLAYLVERCRDWEGSSAGFAEDRIELAKPLAPSSQLAMERNAAPT